jgi:hypothetical protein
MQRGKCFSRGCLGLKIFQDVLGNRFVLNTGKILVFPAFQTTYFVLFQVQNCEEGIWVRLIALNFDR